jgi:hypothetical protein
MGSFWFNTFFSYIVGVGNVYIGNSSNIASSLTFNENTVPALLVKTSHNMGRSPNYGRNSNILIPDPLNIYHGTDNIIKQNFISSSSNPK